MRFLQALLMAIANLLTAGGKGLEWCWRTACGLLPGGGGGSATPQPLDLPSKEVFDVDRSLAESQQYASDLMASENAARQVQIYAATAADRRFEIDLSKVEPQHQDWLIALSTDERAMKVLSEAHESKITMLLSGHDGAVPGIDAPKPEKAKDVIPGLVSRIDDFRRKSGPGETNHILAA